MVYTIGTGALPTFHAPARGRTQMPSLEAQSTAVAITAGQITLRGRLHLPANANGVVPFAHDGESSRHLGEHLRKDANIAA